MSYLFSRNRISRIVKREDGYYVMSDHKKDGKYRHLGGPYKSKSEANKRLREVEYFKHAAEDGDGEDSSIYDFIEADESATSKKQALDNVTFQVKNGESGQILQMYEDAARRMGATGQEIREAKQRGRVE